MHNHLRNNKFNFKKWFIIIFLEKQEKTEHLFQFLKSIFKFTFKIYLFYVKNDECK
jgi:hypothetical protein